MWGEVDHKTIYKSKQYDLFKESRKEITEQIFKVLHASDKQLNTLYTQKYTQAQLLEALFYEMTNAEIVSTTNTSLLGIHYSNFYSIFNRDNFLNKAYREYIVKRLLEEKYLKKECPSINVNDDIRYFVDYINENYLAYHINMLYHIASILLKFKDNDHFKIYMISRIIDKHKDTAISDASQSSLVVDEFDDDAFDDTAYGDESRDSWKNDVIVSMDSWFKKRDKNGNKH